jgi:hypothetical protein
VRYLDAGKILKLNSRVPFAESGSVGREVSKEIMFPSLRSSFSSRDGMPFSASSCNPRDASAPTMRRAGFVEIMQSVGEKCAFGGKSGSLLFSQCIFRVTIIVVLALHGSAEERLANMVNTTPTAERDKAVRVQYIATALLPRGDGEAGGG